MVLVALRTYEPPVSKELCCLRGGAWERVCSRVTTGNVGDYFCSEVLIAAGVSDLGLEPSQKKYCCPYAFLYSL